MIKQSKFAIAGCIFGALFGVFSSFRYWVMFSDPDKAIVYTLIGIVIIGISFLYDRVLKLSNTLDNLEEYIVDKEDKNVRKKNL